MSTKKIVKILWDDYAHNSGECLKKSKKIPIYKRKTGRTQLIQFLKFERFNTLTAFSTVYVDRTFFENNMCYMTWHEHIISLELKIK